MSTSPEPDAAEPERAEPVPDDVQDPPSADEPPRPSERFEPL
ncbi:hypothetical protein [Streptomyces sp. NPDC020917]